MVLEDVVEDKDEDVVEKEIEMAVAATEEENLPTSIRHQLQTKKKKQQEKAINQGK